MDFYSKKLKIIIVIILGIIFLSLSLYKPSKVGGENFIVWNVGQGQMLTYQTPKMCAHFDAGGERKRFPKNKLLKLCYDKENIIYYTHWDQDHINFSSHVQKIFPSLCRAKISLKDPKKKYKLRRIKKIPFCKKTPDKIKELTGFYHRAKTSNERSRIFVIANKILVPGDSNKKMEKYWSSLIPPSIEVLVAGHHGSKTSSSPLLISKLKNLKLVVVSARKQKYGHPHPSVVKRFNQKKILVKTTEDFGHIRIPLLQ